MTIKVSVKKLGDNNSTSDVRLLNDALISIGTSPQATIVLKGEKIAPEQCVVYNENGAPLFINQANGTILNGTEIRQGVQQPLSNGDTLQIGAYLLKFELEQVRTSAVGANAAASAEPFRVAADEADKGVFEDILSAELLSDGEEEPEQSVVSSDAPTAVNKETQSFADILNSLRKDEDQFYFQVEDADGAIRRIPIADEETRFGWSETQKAILPEDVAKIEYPLVSIRKDWGGVTVYPVGKTPVHLNGEILSAVTQLRNGDKLAFSNPTVKTNTIVSTLIFHEPAALVELNSMLPKQLISNALEVTQIPDTEVITDIAADIQPIAVPAAAPPVVKSETRSRIFGHFSALEILIMIFATVVCGALTYFLLDNMF